MWSTTKYAVVFEFSNCDKVYPQRVETYPNLEDGDCLRFIKELKFAGQYGGIHLFIDDAFPKRVYKDKAAKDFQKEWMFIPQKSEEKIVFGILKNEPYWVLFQKEQAKQVDSGKKGLHKLTDSQKDEYLENPSINILAKEAIKEINIIRDVMIKDIKSRRVRLVDSIPSDLQQVAIDMLDDPEYTFKWIKKADFKDLNLFAEMKNSTHSKRYFKETLLQEIIKRNTSKQDITKPQIRTLIKKIQRH